MQQKINPVNDYSHMYQNRLEDIVTLINKNLKNKEEDK